MKRLVITLLVHVVLLVKLQSVNAQMQYAVSSIPKELSYRAGAVIRNQETTIEVKSLDNVVYHTKAAVTILNSSGDREAVIALWYDQITKIKYVKGTVYDEFGRPVSRFTDKDFSDVSAVSASSLFEDSRLKRLKPGLLTYPYTIEYEYELRAKHSLYFPDWYPLESTGTAIEKSALTFTCPTSFNLRYKEVNYKGLVEKSTGKNTKVYRWAVNNVAALRPEPMSPDIKHFLTVVELAPESFYYQGLKGSFSNWQEYGQWVHTSLLTGRDALPEATVAHIRQLVKDIDDPKLKAKKIYQYMQSKTRYISVQIGIGGFQPFPASEVDRLSYGDCKALVNYTQALLKVAGIPSYYTIVYAGSFKKDMDPAFASMSGNHAILCLPFPNDTTWLECTSKEMPFGYLGDFTDDRLVVACTPEGGKLMRTPKLAADINRQVRKAHFQLSAKGDLRGTVHTTFEGSQYDNHERLSGEPFTEQVKLLAKYYPFPNLEVTSLDYKQDKEVFPQTTEQIALRSYNYAALSGNTMLLSLNIINNSSTLKEVKNRNNPVYINRGYTDEDEFVFDIPEGFKVDSPLKVLSMDKPFATYKASIEVKDRQIIYKRRMVVKEGIYPAEQYQDLVNFYNTTAEADMAKVILKR